jgi:hypothetical protein
MVCIRSLSFESMRIWYDNNLRPHPTIGLPIDCFTKFIFIFNQSINHLSQVFQSKMIFLSIDSRYEYE